MFSAKYVPKPYMASQFNGGATPSLRILAFKNPLCDNTDVNSKPVGVRYANIVKNENKPKNIINPIESNKILPGWVSLTKVNGRTEIKYGIARDGFNFPAPLRTYDELLDECYCIRQQRYWDNDIKLKGALSVYYGRQTLDEWAKCEEEERIRKLNCISDTEINEEVIHDKAASTAMDAAMRRIKKNARIIMNDCDSRDYNYE